MTRTAKLLLLIPFCVPGGSLVGQGLDPALLTRPAIDSWPTYAGDYSQRRYSALRQVDTSNVRHLSLAWVSRLTAGAGGGEGGFFGPPGTPPITGGVAENPVNIPGSTSGSPRLSGSILQVNGILYVTSPDNAWAMDALDGHILWHYWWKSRGGTHIGNRGMAMHGDWLFFETPDDYLVSLDAKTGQERWHKEIADFTQQYFSTTAPVVVGDHVLVGTGDDLDAPGFLQSFDPKTGDLQWKFYTVPMKRGDPGLDTWASLDAAQHGAAARTARCAHEPVHLLGGRRDRRDGKDGMVLPDVAERHARLGFDPAAGAGRRDVRGEAAENGDAGVAQWLLLRAGSNQWRASAHDEVLRRGQLGCRHQRQGAARAQPGQGQHDRGLAGIAGQWRRDELASGQLRPPDGALLRRAARALRDVLPDNDGPTRDGRAGRQRAGCRRIARYVHRRDRLPDGKARLEISLRGNGGRLRRCHRFAHNRGGSAVRQRRVRESCCPWAAGEAVARASLARPYRLD